MSLHRTYMWHFSLARSVVMAVSRPEKRQNKKESITSLIQLLHD